MKFDRFILSERRFVSILLVSTILVCAIGSGQEGDTSTDLASVKDVEFFEDEIVPILKRRCYECHSHESGKAKGGLVLDSRQGWRNGGGSGTAIVAGKPNESFRLCDVDVAQKREARCDAAGRRMQQHRQKR